MTFLRFAIAAVGGFAITVGMLLMMSDFAENLRERDGMRYFRITDFIPATESRLPPPPRAPALPPDRPRVQYQRGQDRLLRTDRPIVDQPTVGEPPVREPTLDPSEVVPDEPE